MNLENIKNEAQLPVGKKLVNAEAAFIDGTLKSVNLIFEGDERVHIAIRSYDVLLVAVKAAPKLVKRYRVSGKLLGVDLTQAFADKNDANRYENKLNATEGVENVEQSDVMLPEDQIVLDDLPF